MAAASRQSPVKGAALKSRHSLVKLRPRCNSEPAPGGDGCPRWAPVPPGGLQGAAWCPGAAPGLGRAVFSQSLLWYRSVKSPRDALANATGVSAICFQGLYLVLSLGGVR